MQRPIVGNAVAPHLETEKFQDYAYAELAAAMPHEQGVCFLPECSANFTPTREWQIHCRPACARKTKSEMRTWGHKMAIALLVHRMGKYEKFDVAIRERTKAARRFITHLQSEWLRDRQRRSAASKAGVGS
ncbi:MAG: hypothetical protein COB08_005560 [Rhodobacteraceae bacterium]|nr:hypothetical protein [Paracoccaceae bacterium]